MVIQAPSSFAFAITLRFPLLPSLETHFPALVRALHEEHKHRRGYGGIHVFTNNGEKVRLLLHYLRLSFPEENPRVIIHEAELKSATAPFLSCGLNFDTVCWLREDSYFFGNLSLLLDLFPKDMGVLPIASSPANTAVLLSHPSNDQAHKLYEWALEFRARNTQAMVDEGTLSPWGAFTASCSMMVRHSGNVPPFFGTYEQYDLRSSKWFYSLGEDPVTAFRYMELKQQEAR